MTDMFKKSYLVFIIFFLFIPSLALARQDVRKWQETINIVEEVQGDAMFW